MKKQMISVILAMAMILSAALPKINGNSIVSAASEYIVSSDFFINEALKDFEPGKDIYLFEDTTVYDFCSSITTNYADFKVIDENNREWNAQSPDADKELMKGKYIIAGGLTSKIISVYSKTLKYENYNDDINDISSSKNVIRVTAEYSNEPLGGKENDRYIIVRDNRGNEGAGYLGYSSSKNYLVATEPIWISFSYYATDLGTDSQRISFAMRDDDVATPMASLLVTTNKDKVKEDTGYLSSDMHLINANEWNRIAVKIYPESTKTDLIINGREYYYENISSTGARWETNFRNIRFNMPNDMTDFVFAVDDVAIYAGKPKISFALPDVTLLSDSDFIDVDNQKCVLYINKNITETDMYNHLRASEGIYRIVKDSHGFITKIAIPNGNLVFKYYNVITLGAVPDVISFHADRERVYAKLAGYTDDVVMILAEYKDATLVNVKVIDDISLRGEQVITAERVNTDGDTECRAYLLESLENIKPLTNSIYVPSSDIYNYRIPDDPGYITDESFFGLWDNTTSTWIKEPYFAYEKYPSLSRVEEAAKAGDYKTAKKELLSYYQDIANNRVTTVKSDPGNTARVRTELLEKNFYAVSHMNGLALNIFDVENEWKQISIDVTNSVLSAKGNEKYRTFVIASIDKKDSCAEFQSKESDHSPTLVLNMNNGETRIFTAVKDSYISAGTNADTNYGSLPTLYVQESGTYQNHNHNTKRAYIAFDISSLKPTDQINSATLNLYGRNSTGTGRKEMLLYQWNDSNWEEETVTWNYFSDHLMFSCNDSECWDYVTSNDPTEKGKVCFFHRGDELIVASNLYSYTGDDRYAYTFIRQFMGLIDSIGVNPNVMNALDISCHIDNMSEGLLRVVDSCFMTPEVFTAALKHFWLANEWLVNNYYGKAINNWGSFATLGVYSIAARFCEFSAFDRWFDATVTENDRLNQNFTRPDGSSVELAQGYMVTLLNTLYQPFSISKVTGVPLPYSPYVFGQFYKQVKFLLYTTSPGYKGFHVGDSMDYNVSRVSFIKMLSELFKEDEELKYVATNGSQGKLPDFTSVTFPDGLWTVMRSDWSDKALALHIGAKGIGSHGHRDQLSISMFAYGKYLLTDQSYGTILTGNIRDYMISAQQHNTVTMNSKDQITNVDGTLDRFEAGAVYDYVQYSSPATVDASKHLRSVLFMRDAKFWIVSDYLKPKNEGYNLYDQHWHMLPAANITIDNETKIARSNFEDVNVMVIPVGINEFYNVSLQDNIFSPSAGSLIPGKKAVYTKYLPGDVTFDTILLPLDKGQSFSVQTEVIDCGLGKSANSFVLTLTDTVNNVTKKYYYYHLNDLTSQSVVDIGKYRTDATLMMVEEDEAGNALSIVLHDATILYDTNSNTTLFSSPVPVNKYEKIFENN